MSMKLSLLCLLACIITFSAEPEKIFDGSSLDNFVLPKKNIWWSLKDGAIYGKSGPKRKGSIIWSKKKYKNFEIEFEFKMGHEKRIDTGFFIRKEEDQVQIGESGSLKKDMTGMLYLARGGKYVKTETEEKKVLHRSEWNKMKVRAVGNHYSVWLNGKKTMETKSKTAIEEGPIGFQIHGARDMSCWFRNITITTLD